MGSKLCNMRVILALALLAASARALPTPNDVVPEFIAAEPEVPKAVKQAVEACQVINQEQVCEDLDAKACIAEGAGISGRCKTCAECIARGMHTDVNGLFAKLQAGQELVQAELSFDGREEWNDRACWDSDKDFQYSSDYPSGYKKICYKHAECAQIGQAGCPDKSPKGWCCFKDEALNSGTGCPAVTQNYCKWNSGDEKKQDAWEQAAYDRGERDR